ncbi:MAG: CoA transferase, partial [Chloroflexota bacterium]|nr:CoA transferase [Chloroflexota bacterium]
QYIDFALNDLTLSLMPEVITDYTMNGRIRQPEGNRDEIMAPHNVYRCLGEDKWVAIAVDGEGKWGAFCQVLGHPEWQEDQRFNDPFRRWQNQGELDPLIEAWTEDRTPYQVTEALQGAGIAAAPSFDIADLVSDPHLRERGVFQEIDHPEVGKRQYIGIPWKLDGVAPRFDPAPLLGEGNQYVFGDLLGLSPEEIRRLEEEKAIF